MTGIPLELITMLGSTILGGVMSLFSKSQESKHERELALIGRYDKEKAERNYIRRSTNKTFSFTRRTIALVSILSIIMLPKIAALLAAAFDWPLFVTVGYHEVQSGFWFFTDDKDTVTWKEAAGLAITPLDTHLVSAIVGLYFGNKIGR